MTSAKYLPERKSMSRTLIKHEVFPPTTLLNICQLCNSLLSFLRCMEEKKLFAVLLSFLEKIQGTFKYVDNAVCLFFLCWIIYSSGTLIDYKEQPPADLASIYLKASKGE